MMSASICLFFWFMVGHSLADFPLQGDFVARGKNHKAPIPGVPWVIVMSSHAFVHAGAVALVSGSISLGVLEYVWHYAIDVAKNAGAFGEGSRAFTVDQALHVICKVIWVGLLMTGVLS